MFFFIVFYCFIQFLKKPNPVNIIALGLSTGLALLSKFTSNLIPPLLILLLLIFFTTREFKQTKLPAARYITALLLSFAIALLVLNAGYGFRDTLQPISNFPWRSALFNNIKNSPIGKIPLPIPYLYLDAIDEQMHNRNLFLYYLRGQLSTQGWPSYYWIALLIKTPLPLLIASTAALTAAFRRAATYYERLLWAVPALFMFAFTFFIRIDMGFRYLYPIIPFLIILSAAPLARLAASGKKAAAVASILCALYAASTLQTFGNGLAYFNEIPGGPSGGHKYIVESSLDWGQNLVRLKKYVDNTQPSPLLVYNYGLVPPAVYGVQNAGWVPCEPIRAVVAISVNYLKGVDPFQHRPKECFNWLSSRKPSAILGHGLYIYDTRNDASIPVPDAP